MRTFPQSPLYLLFLVLFYTLFIPAVSVFSFPAPHDIPPLFLSSMPPTASDASVPGSVLLFSTASPISLPAAISYVPVVSDNNGFSLPGNSGCTYAPGNNHGFSDS